MDVVDRVAVLPIAGLLAALTLCGCDGSDHRESALPESEAARENLSEKPLFPSPSPRSGARGGSARIGSESSPATKRDPTVSTANARALSQGFAAARAGQFRAALAQIDLLAESTDRLPPAAIGLRGDCLTALGRWEEAVTSYRRLLTRAPAAVAAHRQLAAVLNHLGCRAAAMQHLRALARAGDIRSNELAALVCRKDPASTRPGGRIATQGEIGRGETSEDRLPPVAAARAALSRDDHRQAWGRLKRFIVSSDGMSSTARPVAVALAGRIAAEADNADDLRWWLSIRSEASLGLPDDCVAVGIAALHRLNDPASAAAWLTDALQQDPTDWVCAGLLENLCDRLHQPAAAEVFQRQAFLTRRSILVANTTVTEEAVQASQAMKLADVLDRLNRPLEATLWRLVTDSAVSSGEEAKIPARQTLMARYRQLRDSPVAFGRPDRFQTALAGVVSKPPTPSQFSDPLLVRRLRERLGVERLDNPPRVAATDNSAAHESTDQAEMHEFPFRWDDRTEALGVRFRYRNAAEPVTKNFQLYQQFGGGVAALDFDLDGRVDLYFGQAAGEPLREDATHSDVLYRYRSGGFVDVSEPGRIDDRQYTLGVSAGDVNQDGFDDLLVANFGRNAVLINNGDGTFRRPSTDPSGPGSHAKWTSCLAVADVNDDQLPDVVEINYVDDPAVFDIPPRNEDGRYVTYRGPETYRPAADRVWLQGADATWEEVILNRPGDTGGEAGSAAPGLGVVVADVDRRKGNEIFIANDTEPNGLWTRTGKQRPDQTPMFRDTAPLRGCAYSSRGGSGASMGIAAADFDGNGRLDFHVTNFYNEAVNVYLQVRENRFVDRVVATGLLADSTPVLGFGTVASDIDLDGRPDLTVLNGHIEDLRFRDAPFRMRPQQFRGGLARFRRVDPMATSSAPSFFETEALGRGLIDADIDRDGKMDLIATHLDRPVRILINRTETDHAWTQFRLVGRRSARQAVGATVRVKTDTGTWHGWQTTGDGYSCRRENRIALGLGESTHIVSLRVTWPDATVQYYRDVPINQSLLLVEGQPAWRVAP